MKAIHDQRFITSADRAYEIICGKILSGELSPGSKLTRRKMAELTNVSIIPVIEALHRLEDEGLVVSEPHFGSHVIQLTDDVIRDRFAMRLAVECQVVRILSSLATVEQLHRLQFLSEELDRLPRHGDVETADPLRGKHYSFHLALAEYTRCPTFVQALHRLNLFDLLQKSIATYSSTHHEVPENHHTKIVTAIRTGDPAHAESVMRAHILFSGLCDPEEK